MHGIDEIKKMNRVATEKGNQPITQDMVMMHTRRMRLAKLSKGPADKPDPMCDYDVVGPYSLWPKPWQEQEKHKQGK